MTAQLAKDSIWSIGYKKFLIISTSHIQWMVYTVLVEIIYHSCIDLLINFNASIEKAIEKRSSL